MGLFDTLGEIFDIAVDIVTLPVKIAGAAVETATDISEHVVTDVHNKVTGKGEQDIETSYDVRDKADKMVEEINKKYWSAQEALNTAYSALKESIKATAALRSRVYVLLGRRNGGELRPLPDETDLMLQRPSLQGIDSLQFNLGTTLGNAGIKLRMEAAQEYLSNAKDYKNDVAEKIASINQLRRRVISLKNALKEEVELLTVIEQGCALASRECVGETIGLLQEVSKSCLSEVDENTEAHYRILLSQIRALW